MRILFTRFPLESARGGLENQTMSLAVGLRDRGHEVRFLGSCWALLESFGVSGFPVTKLDIGSPPVTKWSVISFLWRKAEMKKRMIAAIDAMPEKPDAVCMLSLSDKLLLTDVLSERGIRVFWIEHDRIGRWLTKNPWLSLLKKQSAYATIVCVSELSRTKYAEMGFDELKIVAIANGITECSPPPSGEGLGERVGKGKIGTVARLSPEKGIDVLLQAIADLPELSLSIVGSGPEEGEIRRLIHQDTERLGLGIPRIDLQKAVPELSTFLASLDIFVLPSSDHDPFGLVVAEAMACGTPVVVTDACGISGYLQDGIDALIVFAGSVAALREALQKVQDPALRERLASAGRRTALEHFSVQCMIDAYEKVLRNENT